MKLTQRQTEEIMGIVARGNQTEAAGWLEREEPGVDPITEAPKVEEAPAPEAPKEQIKEEEEEAKSKKKGK